jgi:phosphoglycerate kinase
MSIYNELINIDINGKNILIREDLNVPLQNGNIINDARIKATLPTIKYALSKGAKLAIISHFGRPTEGKFDEKYSLKIVSERLSEILGIKVFFEDQPLDVKSPEYINNITLYENTRFLIGEKSGDEVLANKIAKNCDVFVMDAFGASHRKHSSTFTVSKYAPITCGGILLIDEIKNIEKFFKNPTKPVLAIIGGSKISTKLNILKKLITKVDAIIIGGGIANTFLLSSGYPIGKSLVEINMINDAKKIINLAKKNNVSIPLPEDVICSNSNNSLTRNIGEVSNEEMIKDIGPKTSTLYKKFIKEAGTILWNGPVGVFEEAMFENGTKDIAYSIKETKALTIAGGGDTISAIEKFINFEDLDYISTGGGAFLEFLEGNELPGIKIIKKL